MIIQINEHIKCSNNTLFENKTNYSRKSPEKSSKNKQVEN